MKTWHLLIENGSFVACNLVVCENLTIVVPAMPSNTVGVCKQKCRYKEKFVFKESTLMYEIKRSLNGHHLIFTGKVVQGIPRFAAVFLTIPTPMT